MIELVVAVKSPKVETCAVKQEAETLVSCKPTPPLGNSTKEGDVNHAVSALKAQPSQPYHTKLMAFILLYIKGDLIEHF